jgi:hypothetical protein
MTYLSLLAIIRSEDPVYIEEWVNHHRGHGVEHFYLLDHVPNPVPIPALKNVTVIEVPSPRRQNQYYFEALQAIHARWCLVIDADEFLVAARPLADILPDYEDFDGLGVHWLMFGSSRRKEKVYPVHGGYQWRTPFEHSENRHIKSVINPATVHEISNDPHFFIGTKTVNERYEPLHGAFDEYCGDLLRLNHYWTRSEADWRDKLVRGRADCDIGDGRSWQDFHRLNAACTVYDPDPCHINNHIEIVTK